MAATLPLHCLVPWKTGERPPDWSRLFGRDAPLEVEIGFGNGDFMVRRAGEHPERDFIGVENQWPSVKRALSRVRSAGVDNVRIVLGDARVAFERLLRPASLTRVTALFPCPWPKKKHVRHRLFTHAFLSLVASRLCEGGRFLLVTDAEDLASWTLEQVPGSGLVCRHTKVPPSFGTKYEHKWRAEGQGEFHELVFDRTAAPDVPLLEDVTVQAGRIVEFDPERFEPRAHSDANAGVHFKDLLWDPARECAMVLTVVSEGSLDQTFWIAIEKTDDAWRVLPARGCGVIPTAGVQRALDRLVEAATTSD